MDTIFSSYLLLVTPACESVLVHIFVSGLYGVVNKIVPVFRAWNFQREKVDFLVAVGEKLCNLEANEDTRKLENIKNCSLLEPTKNWDEMPEEYATMASEMVSFKFQKLYTPTNDYFIIGRGCSIANPIRYLNKPPKEKLEDYKYLFVVLERGTFPSKSDFCLFFFFVFTISL